MKNINILKDLKQTYTDFHKSRNPVHVYPNEFVVRTFLGTYPNLSLDKTKYAHSRILDLGFGDGRNIPVLYNLIFKVYGVEITEEICAMTIDRMKRLSIEAELVVGNNSNIPFEDGFFDYILSSSSCYYVNHGTTFDDNLNEIQRVLRPRGIFIASFPESNTFIFKDCKDIGDGHVMITNDPFGMRNGYIFRRFQSKEEIREKFSSYFEKFSFGYCEDDYYGLQHNHYLMVCKKKISKYKI